MKPPAARLPPRPLTGDALARDPSIGVFSSARRRGSIRTRTTGLAPRSWPVPLGLERSANESTDLLGGDTPVPMY
jgi:hypothetical protein